MRRTAKPAKTAKRDLETFTEVEKLLAAGPVDYLVCLLPSTGKTQKLLSAAILRDGRVAQREAAGDAQLPPAPVLLNAGRGDLIDEDEILLALDEGLLSGAVLDVFAAEPLRPDSPLWQHPDVVITPHIAMLSFGDDVIKVFYDNLARLDSGKDLLYVANWEEGY